MFVLICLSGSKSRIIRSIQVLTDCKSDSEAVAAALDFQTEFTSSDVIEVWDCKADLLVCRLTFD